MHSISIKNLSKKYNRTWLFKNVNAQIISGAPVAVKGYNGSGKSTLLKIISGYTVASEGSIDYSISGKTIGQEEIYRHISFAAPYLDLIEDFTLLENIHFFTRFKKLQQNLSAADLINIAFPGGCHNGPLKVFSSGMKQRLKLALALLADTPIVLLDEPLANFDSQGFDWYGQLASQYLQNRICIICSNNISHEVAFCKNVLNVEAFK